MTNSHSLKNQRGFTMIELMITIGIVAILASVAVPAYKDYAVRAKVTELINVANGAKLAVSEMRITDGKYPQNDAELNMDIDKIKSKYVSKLAIKGKGVIEVTGQDLGDDKLKDLTIVMTPDDSGSTIDWECGVTNKDHEKFVPKMCAKVANSHKKA